MSCSQNHCMGSDRISPQTDIELRNMHFCEEKFKLVLVLCISGLTHLNAEIQILPSPP
jgi:hypothetical protein